ncbi:chymotrypsinogen A-like [Dermacentor andersoni]|uniref:chymotrypsinogen A-like n=1 Tax=Dermacentor andersoni TaxID=34620 RepID=UPI002155EA1E|nr:chymotrypsinogen A-like [Dermacentor andersoni]
MRALLLCAALLVCSATAHHVGECGVPRIQPHLEAEDRIEGGKEAVPGSWPWHVQVNTRSGHHRCSGALIDDEHVVTAASCIWKLKDIGVLKVLAGAHSRDAVAEGERSADVVEACVFKGYQGSHVNNIAILKLKKPLSRTDTIQPICLPDAPVVGGWNVYATGYGHTHHDHDSPVKGLSQARVKTVANNMCYDENDTEVPKSVFCTVYDHGSPCMHDIGGPVMSKVDGAWTLHGVVSGGAKGCKVGEHPMLHTRVALFADFIDKYTHATGAAGKGQCDLRTTSA